MSAVRFCDGYSGEHFEHNAIKEGRCYVLAAEYDAMQRDLATVQGERELLGARILEQDVRQERDAALERVRELEKGLQFIMFHIEAPQDSDIPADQYIPTLSEAVVCRNEIQRLLALRAGMA